MKPFNECDHLDVATLSLNGKLARVACRQCGFIGKVRAVPVKKLKRAGRKAGSIPATMYHVFDKLDGGK